MTGAKADRGCSCKQAAALAADNKLLINENADLRRTIQELRGALIEQERALTNLSLHDNVCP